MVGRGTGKNPRWGDLPLWGKQVDPEAWRSTPNSHDWNSQLGQPKPSLLGEQCPHFRDGTRIIGIFNLRLGLIHFCCLGENQGVKKKRQCREFHHFDGIDVQSNGPFHPLVVTVAFEGAFHRQVLDRRVLPLNCAWELPVRNLRSRVYINVYFANRGNELDSSTFVLIGGATFTILSVLEEEASSKYPLSDSIDGESVRSFECFYRRGPQANCAIQKLSTSQQVQVEKLLWYDLRDGGENITGRIGIQRYFDDGSTRQRCFKYFTNAYGAWEEGKRDSGNYAFVGNGVPPRSPDNRRSIPGAFSKMFEYLNRIRAVITYSANVMNAAASVQSWSHWPTSLSWFVALSTWSWLFRLQHLPQHMIIFSIFGLVATYRLRRRGQTYVTRLTPSSAHPGKAHVDRHVGRMSLSVLKASLPLARTQGHLRVQVVYFPGSGVSPKEGGLGAESHRRNLTLNVGTFDEVRGPRVQEADNTIRWRKFSARGRTCNLFKRLVEATLTTADRASTLRNRTFVWTREQRLSTPGGTGTGSGSAEGRSGHSVEALRYPVLQSVTQKPRSPELKAVPWPEHTGRLVFYLRRDPALHHAEVSHKTVGSAEVFVRDLVDSGVSIQPCREMQLPIRPVGDYKMIGDLQILVQLELPENPTRFGSFERLQQQELESIVCNHHWLTTTPRPPRLRSWVKAKTDFVNRNLQWLAYWGDDLYAVQNLFRWAHPWKTGYVLLFFLVALLVVSTLPFHRLLFGTILAAFGEGLYSKLKWNFRKDKKPSKVEVSLFGMKLKCSPTSALHRVRNFLNSLPNDRDDEEHFAPRRRVVQAREEFLQHSSTRLRGELWAGPLLVKWKSNDWSTSRPRSIFLNVKASADFTYKSRYVVVYPGFLRLFSGRGRKEASHQAAEGHDQLRACGGWIAVSGNCSTLVITQATATPWKTRRGVPCVIVNERPRQEGATSWKLSLCCVDEGLRAWLVEVLCAAGCIEAFAP